MGGSTRAVWALACVKACRKGASTPPEAEKKNVNWRTFCKRHTRVGGLAMGIVTFSKTKTLATSLSQGALSESTTFRCIWSPCFFELLHGLACLVLVSAELLHSLSFANSETTDEALISLNIMNVQVDLLLQHHQLFVHLNLQAVSTCLNLCFHLDHFFFLIYSSTSVNQMRIRTNKFDLPSQLAASFSGCQHSSA